MKLKNFVEKDNHERETDLRQENSEHLKAS